MDRSSACAASTEGSRLNVARKRWALALGTAAITSALAGLAWWTLHRDASLGAGAGFAPAANMGFLLAPNAEWRHTTDDFDVQVVTNSLGLRGPEVMVPKPSDRYRVLVLGDSFTFGWGVERDDAWHAVMARALRGPGHRELEVIAAGVPGWSPPQQFVFLEQRGLDLQPDLVLWQLCTNDLVEMERLDVEIDARRLPVAVAVDPPLSTGLREEWTEPLEHLDETERQQLAADYTAGRVNPVLRDLAWKADTARRARAGPAPEGPVTELPVDEVLRGLRSGPDFGVRYLDHLATAARVSCAERGIELRLILAQTRPTPRGVDAPDHGIGALRKWAARQSPKALDTAHLLSAERAHGHFFQDDPHWTSAAHATVAQAVASWLARDTKLDLSPSPSR